MADKWDEDMINKVANELYEPDLSEGYELFTESHGFKIYRLYNKVSGLYQYKTYGDLNVPAEICAKVYMDLEYRKKWDSYVNELEEISEGDKKGVYWQVNFPFLMSNRDYIYRRQYNEMEFKGKRTWLIFGESEVFESVPKRSRVIRVEDYKQKLVFTENDSNGIKAYMHYYDNPGGSIPTMLINWAAKTGVPSFLTEMEKACERYPDYLKTLEKS